MAATNAPAAPVPAAPAAPYPPTEPGADGFLRDPITGFKVDGYTQGFGYALPLYAYDPSPEAEAASNAALDVELAVERNPPPDRYYGPSDLHDHRSRALYLAKRAQCWDSGQTPPENNARIVTTAADAAAALVDYLAERARVLELRARRAASA